MKKNLTTWSVVITASLLFTTSLEAQIGALNALKNKAKSVSEKVVDKATDRNESSDDSSKLETKPAVAIAAEDMKDGQGYFFTTFKANWYKSEVTASEELYIRMQLGKTMIEWSQEKGIQADYTAYGFITVYIDGEKVFMTKPISFASNISKQWVYIDIPLNVSPDFLKQIESDQSMLETQQDIWMFQQLFQENSIPKQYGAAAMSKLASGNHKVKVEFGLGQSDSKEPMAVICTGDVAVKSPEGGSNALSKYGPKHLRPLNEDEKGLFQFATASFEPGTSDISAVLNLPKPPKYYNMKWCQASSCDYDHGYIEFYVSIDGKPLTAWSKELDGDDYQVTKQFNMTILPKTDAGYDVVEAPFNSSKLYEDTNPIAYALWDMLYGGKLSQGTHKLVIKAYSRQSIPLNTAYEFEAAYFAKWPAIAETSIDLIINANTITNLSTASSSKKLSHASGDWVAVDNHLKQSSINAQVVDVATKTEWKVVTNSLGAILYRTCKADVVYTGEYGTRLQKGVLVKEDYTGGASYGKPYFAERIEISHGPSLLGTMHIPVPLSKMK